MAEPVRHLRLIDAETGEVHEDGCPNCGEKDEALSIAHRKLQGAWLQIARMEKDVESEQEDHDDRPLVEALHAQWQEECKRARSELDMGKDSRFEAYLRGLKLGRKLARKLGLKLPPADMCRLGIAGAAFDPYTRQMRNGGVERYDDPTTIFKNAASFERFVNRAPVEARERLLKPTEEAP